MDNLVVGRFAGMDETPGKSITADRLFDNRKLLLTYEELAERLNVSMSSLTKWVHRNEMPFYRFGRSVRFDAEEVANWLSSKRSDHVSR